MCKACIVLLQALRCQRRKSLITGAHKHVQSTHGAATSTLMKHVQSTHDAPTSTSMLAKKKVFCAPNRHHDKLIASSVKLGLQREQVGGLLLQLNKQNTVC